MSGIRPVTVGPDEVDTASSAARSFHLLKESPPNDRRLWDVQSVSAAARDATGRAAGAAEYLGLRATPAISPRAGAGRRARCRSS